MSDKSGSRTIAQELRRLGLFIALPLALLIAAITYTVDREARRDAEALVQRESARLANDVTRFLDETERGLRLVAARAGARGMDPAHCDPGLEDLIAIQPRYVNVNLTDRDGWVICGAKLQARGPRSLNVSKLDWFRAVMAGKSFATGAPEKETIAGRWISTAAAPVHGAGGEFAGVVSVAIDLAGWQGQAAQDLLPQDAVLGVIDSAGTIVMRSGKADEWVGRNFRDFPLFATMLGAGEGSLVATGAQGFERIWAVTPIAGTDWRAYAGIRASGVQAQPLKQAAFTLALAAALALAVWLALLASRRLAQPIAAIARAARARASGSDDLLPVVGPSEVEELAQELNRMFRERQRAEEALREHDARYRTVVETSKEGFWVVDREGRLVDVNEAYVRRSGFTREELLGMRISDLDAKETPAETAAHMDSIVRGDGDVFETLHRTRDGAVWPVEISVANSADHPGQMLCFLRDITARSQAEEALRGSEARWQFALEGAGDGVWDWNAKTNEVYFSPRWKAILGFADAEIGSALDEWDKRIYPADRERVYAELDRHLGGATPVYASEHRLQCKDGSYKWILSRGKVIERDEHGRPLRVIGTHTDITERKRAEDEVRMLSRALEQSPAAIVITDRAGNIEYVNPRFEQATGYTRAEAVGRNPRILKSGENAAEVYEQMWATISGGGVWRGELCNRHRNGELFWEFAEISGVKGENGEIERYIGVKENITERKASDAKIRRLGNMYAALSQCNQAVMHCATEQALFEQICRAVVNFGGMKLAWIGMVDQASKRLMPVASYGDVTGYLKTNEVSVDAGAPAGRGPAGTAIRENRPSWCQDFLHDPATEHWHERARRAGWQAAAAVPLCRNGIPVGALSIYSSELNAFDEATRKLVAEMTANISFALDNFAREAERRLAEVSLKESESRLSAIFQASPIGISVARMVDGKVLDANDAALRMYGHTRAEAIGRTAAELGVYADAAQRDALLARLREQGQVEGFELDFRNSSGALGKLELTGRVIELQGEPCLISMMLDVTERKRLEDVHLQAQKLESLGTLAGGIAHDFNNILAAIRGNVDLAVKDVGPDHAAAESLEEIRKASARAGELVRRILAFGRPAEALQEEVDLGAVVGEVLKLLRSTLPAGISLSKAFAEDTPQVLADAGQVHEAIVNLTTNAAHAIGARAGSIEYRLEPVRVGKKLARSIPGIREGRYARLTVTDSGCGMHADTLARIFDAFYTTKPVGEGTGLGLSMVHGTMRSHGGAVAVESTPDQGSSFALYFPVARKRSQKKEQSAPARDLFYAGQRVLYVDDEEALVFLANRVLSHLGHQISGFTDPEQALEAFRAHPQDFDVVVTDLSMPHMSGFELAREILAVRPGIPVLMTTGYIGEEDEGKARAAGISEVILKPVTMDELGEVLDRLIRALPGE